MSKIFVDQVDPKTATTLTLGTSGDTVSIPSGVTLANAGTMTGVPAPTSGVAASAIDSGTIATARLGSGTASSSTFLRGDQTYAAAGGENTPYFQVYKSGNQTISDATFTTVTFESEEYDSGGNFASNTFTAPSTGYYFIYSQLVYVGGTNSNYTLNRLMKNGSPINWVAFVQDSSNGAFGGRVISLSASDTVTVQTYQQSGGNLDLNGGSEDECQFGGYKLIT